MAQKSELFGAAQDSGNFKVEDDGPPPLRAIFAAITHVHPKLDEERSFAQAQHNLSERSTSFKKDLSALVLR